MDSEQEQKLRNILPFGSVNEAIIKLSSTLLLHVKKDYVYVRVQTVPCTSANKNSVMYLSLSLMAYCHKNYSMRLHLPYNLLHHKQLLINSMCEMEAFTFCSSL